MLGITCQICTKREASTHLTELDPSDGQRRELHLCSTCIEQLGLKLQSGPPPISEILKKKPGGKSLTIELTSAATGKSGKAAAETDKDADADSECANCGLTFAEFAVNNRFGCAQCYADFGERIEGMLSRYHGSSVHLGRRPGARPGADDRLARRQRLDVELRDAIAHEAYEKAAKRRDEIRRLSEA